MTSTLETLGKNIKIRLKGSKITQNDLATAVGTSQSGINRYVTGKTAPGVDTLDKLAEALKTTPWELIRPDDAEYLTLSTHEKTMIERYRKLRPIERKAVFGMIKGYLDDASEDDLSGS